MKKLSIALLALTTGHAAVTGDITALIVAFVLFCHTCGKDVVRIWGNMVKGKGDARDCLPEKRIAPNKMRCKDTHFS